MLCIGRKLVTFKGNKYADDRTNQQEDEGELAYMPEGGINIFCFLKHHSHIYKLTIIRAAKMFPMLMGGGVNGVVLPDKLADYRQMSLVEKANGITLSNFQKRICKS